MTRTESNIIASELKGLMPRMTDDQLKCVRDELDKADDPEAARLRLRYYAGSHVDFILSSALSAARGFTDPAERTQREIQEARDQAIRIEQAWAEIDEIIDEITDERMATLKAEALAQMPDLIARRKVEKNPRTDRLLKGMIAQAIRRS